VTSPTHAGYFDANSGGPLSEAARDALLKGIEHGWANPGRLHQPGRIANELLQAARSSIANSLGFEANEICFVQSVPLAFRLGLGGLVNASSHKVVASKVEQSFILEGLGTLDAERVSLIDVDEVGRVDVEAFAKALACDGVTNGDAATNDGAATDDGAATSGLAIVQIASHEVGTKQPWEFLTDDSLAGAVWFADATLGPLSWVQSLKLPKRVDVAVLSPASWSGPLGIAILAIRNGVKFKAQVGLGADPRDAREIQVAVGEPNVGLALASAAALEDCGRRLDQSRDQLTRQSELLRDLLTKEIPDLVLLGDTAETGSTPGLVAFSLLYVHGEALIDELSKRDISITSGSSCVANAVGPSHVLVAMGALTQGNIRVSFNAATSDEDLKLFVQDLSNVLSELRNRAGVTSL